MNRRELLKVAAALPLAQAVFPNTAFTQSAVSELDAGEAFRVGRFKVERGKLCQIERRQLTGVARRISQRVLNRVAHVGDTHLRDDGAVNQFNHRMDD